MRIIILGAGQVGGTLAEHLAGEANEITIVDRDRDRLRQLQDRLDLRTVCGSASLPRVLASAGAEDADMLVAVTSDDEVNMVACQVARTLFNVPLKVARVRERNYLTGNGTLFGKDGFGVDELISPEDLLTDSLAQLLDYPGALQVISFAGDAVHMVAVRAGFGDGLVGNRIADLRQSVPLADFRIAAIYRRNRALNPTGETIIEAGDEVFIVAAKATMQTLLTGLDALGQTARTVIIAGGGNVGARLAARLEKRLHVKLIEADRHRCEALSRELPNTIVLHGSVADRDLLTGEGVEGADIYIAVTQEDKTNIMSCMLAKALGTRTVISLVSNTAFADLVQGGSIDIAVSSRHATMSALLGYVRRGDVVSAHPLRRGTAEAMEVVVHGDQRTSKIVGRALARLKLPETARVAAIVRDGKVMIAHDTLVVQDRDSLILFVADRASAKKVEKLLQVGFAFI
ncbi:MAG: Trk system potassium transporter TrkA [Pseudomonadales bacterium]|nr:Trk system potassium transporter TrkA [Pseudomonadales bacterium]